MESDQDKCKMNVKTQNRYHLNATKIYNVLFDKSIWFACRFLYLRTDRKAVYHLLAVVLLSVLSALIPLPDHYYFVKKNNILNSYFVKLGWFWTCVVVCPFIWFVSTAMRQSLFVIMQNLSRMAIATTVWYYCTHSFVLFEQMTGHCHGSKLSSHSSCVLDGGKWVPGFDISGHCFILIYSSLIICEEALAFHSITIIHRTRRMSPVKNENLIHIFFICMCILHLLWFAEYLISEIGQRQYVYANILSYHVGNADFELLVSVLYYHHIYQKVMGALIAVLCWYFTYHIWYRKVGIPPLPLPLRKMI